MLEGNLENKNKGILWMVSHCETESRTEDYVNKLQSHLKTSSIDILGKCGNDLLPNDSIVGGSLGTKSDSSYYELTYGIQNLATLLVDKLYTFSIYRVK